jgi:hypothetical protein
MLGSPVCYRAQRALRSWGALAMAVTAGSGRLVGTAL